MIERVGKVMYWLLFVLFLPVIALLWMVGALSDVLGDGGEKR